MIAEPPDKITDKDVVGYVDPGFPRGSVFVKDSKGKTLRLEWSGAEGEKEGKPSLRLRSLEPGEYTVTGYRIARRDDSGEEWFVSAILPKAGRSIEVKSGRVVRLEIDSGINLVSSWKLVEGRDFAIRAGFQGIGDSGMTVYREGKRIPLRFRILKANGDELEAGELDYG